MQKKKLLLVGSHGATTAAAIVEEIKSQKLDWDLFFIGKKFSTEKKKSVSLEYQILPELGVKFIEIESGKIQTKYTENTITALLKIPFGIVQSFFKLLKIRPDLVLSIGGASGALVSFWAWVLGIPVLIHEQTNSAGRANIKSSKWAKKIMISRQTSQKYFSLEKTVLTGNPLTRSVIKHLGDSPRQIVKTILVTGGSRGSTWINSALRPIIADLCSQYNVIHQTGLEDYPQFKDERIKNYQVVSQVRPEEMTELLSKADIVVSRAGANTVSELVALKKPSLLIPIPWSYLDEQTENAKWLVSLGLGKILPQKELTPTVLKEEIKSLVVKYPAVIKEVKNLTSPDIAAASDIVDILEKHI